MYQIQMNNGGNYQLNCGIKKNDYAKQKAQNNTISFKATPAVIQKTATKKNIILTAISAFAGMMGIKVAKNSKVAEVTKAPDVHKIKTDKPVDMLDKATQRYYDLTSIVNNKYYSRIEDENVILEQGKKYTGTCQYPDITVNEKTTILKDGKIDYVEMDIIDDVTENTYKVKEFYENDRLQRAELETTQFPITKEIYTFENGKLVKMNSNIYRGKSSMTEEFCDESKYSIIVKDEQGVKSNVVVHIEVDKDGFQNRIK